MKKKLLNCIYIWQLLRLMDTYNKMGNNNRKNWTTNTCKNLCKLQCYLIKPDHQIPYCFCDKKTSLTVPLTTQMR